MAGACAGADLGAGRLANEATMPTAIIGRVTATMILCTERTVVVLRKEKRRCKRRKRQRMRRQQHAAVLIGGLGDRQAKGSCQCVKSCFMRFNRRTITLHGARGSDKFSGVPACAPTDVPSSFRESVDTPL